MNTELREAVFDKGNAVTSLVNKFWYEEAPQKSKYPYAVFSFITSTPSRDTATKFEDVYLQINVFHTDGKSLETIKDAVLAKFDDSESTWSLTSWFFNRIEREFVRPMKVDDVFQFTIQYKIELTKK